LFPDFLFLAIGHANLFLPRQRKVSMKKSQPITQTIKSVASAFLGVQSNKNRERDFNQGKFSHFVVVGLIGVLLFIGVLVTIVSMVLA